MSGPTPHQFTLADGLSIVSVDELADGTSITKNGVTTLCSGLAFPSGILVDDVNPARYSDGVPNTDSQGHYSAPNTLATLYVYQLADLAGPPVPFATGISDKSSPTGDTHLYFVGDKALFIGYSLPVQRDASGNTIEPKRYQWKVFGTAGGTLQPLASGDGDAYVQNGVVVAAGSNTPLYTPT